MPLSPHSSVLRSEAAEEVATMCRPLPLNISVTAITVPLRRAGVSRRRCSAFGIARPPRTCRPSIPPIWLGQRRIPEHQACRERRRHASGACALPQEVLFVQSHEPRVDWKGAP
eukprot:scaffold274513_cov33-Tisochrysis_lutea.AAC.4